MRQPFPSLAQRKVLDLTDRWGQFAGKLLTQLGADVVLGEPPGGHALRRAWPLAVLDGDDVVSLYFWHFNVAKRSVTWDPTDATGRTRCEALASAADLILCGRESYDHLRTELPEVADRATIVVITPYGLATDAAADDLHVAASSAMAGLSGYGDDERSSPIIPAAEQTMHSAGMYAAIAALLGLRSGPSGRGTVFDVSAQASAFQGTEMTFAYASYRDELLRRRTGGYATAFVSGRWQHTTVDGGYVYVFGLLPSTQRSWDALRDWMRSTGYLEDLGADDYADVAALRGSNPYDVTPLGWHASEVIGRFVESQHAEDVYRKGQEIGLGWARVYRPEDTIGDPQYEGRQLFHPTAWPGHDETYLTQTLPWIAHGLDSATPAPTLHPPLPGADTADVLDDWLRPTPDRSSP